MHGKDQQNAYGNAFEHASARLDQLIGELESLNDRRVALLNVAEALGAMIAQGVGHRPESKDSRAVAVHSGRRDRLTTEPLTRVYVHRGDSVKEIQRPTDIAIGR